MASRIHLGGPLRYRLRSAAALCASVAEASGRRMVKGAARRGWNWAMELGTEVLRRQVAIAFRMRDVEEARRFLNAAEIGLPIGGICITPNHEAGARGHWFEREGAKSRLTMLYFHGGGYCFYPSGYARFIGAIARATGCRTFAVDYRLTPEYRFPAQLEDALKAYGWLLEKGTKPGELVVGGDSAGANLTLALLLTLREKKLPPPVMAIALSPPTDFEARPSGNPEQANADWLDWQELQQWAAWFCEASDRSNPLVSPIRADLRGLPPIYMQAGRAEILYESIRAFAEQAHEQGADVVLESWEDMNHDFQVFAPLVPQSVEALRRLREVVSGRTGVEEAGPAVSRTRP